MIRLYPHSANMAQGGIVISNYSAIYTSTCRQINLDIEALKELPIAGQKVRSRYRILERGVGGGGGGGGGGVVPGNCVIKRGTFFFAHGRDVPPPHPLFMKFGAHTYKTQKKVGEGGWIRPCKKNMNLI